MAIFPLVLLNRYSPFDMHCRRGDSLSLCFREGLLLWLVVLTSSFKVFPSNRGDPARGHAFLGVVHIQGLTSGGCQRPVLFTHQGTFLTYHLCSRALPAFGQSFAGLASKFDFSLCLILVVAQPFLGYRHLKNILHPRLCSVSASKHYSPQQYKNQKRKMVIKWETKSFLLTFGFLCLML